MATFSRIASLPIGYGTGTAWFAASGPRVEELKSAVTASLDAGFRHLDEAEMYGNEAATGEALSAWRAAHSEVHREALHITSKIISVDSGVEAICRRSLAAMQLDYFDLYLVHAPFQRNGDPFSTPLPKVWAEMEALVAAGLTRAIGVSNWRVRDLQAIAGSANIHPAVNQVEAHPSTVCP
jgi:diketogulonate reductase-like aldo/keto reductase